METALPGDFYAENASSSPKERFRPWTSSERDDRTAVRVTATEQVVHRCKTLLSGITKLFVFAQIDTGAGWHSLWEDEIRRFAIWMSDHQRSHGDSSILGYGDDLLTDLRDLQKVLEESMQSAQELSAQPQGSGTLVSETAEPISLGDVDNQLCAQLALEQTSPSDEMQACLHSVSAAIGNLFRRNKLQKQFVALGGLHQSDTVSRSLAVGENSGTGQGNVPPSSGLLQQPSDIPNSSRGATTQSQPIGNEKDIVREMASLFRDPMLFSSSADHARQALSPSQDSGTSSEPPHKTLTNTALPNGPDPTNAFQAPSASGSMYPYPPSRLPAQHDSFLTYQYSKAPQQYGAPRYVFQPHSNDWKPGLQNYDYQQEAAPETPPYTSSTAFTGSNVSAIGHNQRSNTVPRPLQRADDDRGKRRDSNRRALGGSERHLGAWAPPRSRLQNDFKRPDRPRKFFIVGRVFRIMLSENAQSRENESDELNSALSQNGYGEWVYTKGRRFVVVRAHDRSCLAVPITTYGGQGCAKPGVDKFAHAIIHTGKVAPPPMPAEGPIASEGVGMQPIPIRVTADDLLEKLDEACRLVLSEPRVVEHYNKVKNFGMVHPKSMQALMTQFQNVLTGTEYRVPLLPSSEPLTAVRSSHPKIVRAYSDLVSQGWSHREAASFVNMIPIDADFDEREVSEGEDNLEMEVSAAEDNI